MGRRFRPFIGWALFALVLLFTIQNAASVETNFIAWSFQMPRAALIFLVFAIGTVCGWILRGARASDKRTGR